MTQLLPLGIGLLVRSKRPQLADRLEKPARLSYGLLSLVVFGLIFALQYRTLAQIRLRGYEGMFALVFLSLLAGWILGGQSIGVRRAVGLTTAARNVGVALVIATASFPGTPAVTAVIALAIFQTVLAAFLALLLGRLSSELRVATA